ncbi:MAG: hypothetical protein ACOZAR_00605 [Patescibacteria group bacterium]
MSELPGYLVRYGKSIRLGIDETALCSELQDDNVLVLGEEKIIDTVEKKKIKKRVEG